MNQMRSNWNIAGLYILASLAVFIGALVSPPFREIAKAPLRDWLLPPPTPVVIPLLYSAEKDAWLRASLKQDLDKTNAQIAAANQSARKQGWRMNCKAF